MKTPPNCLIVSAAVLLLFMTGSCKTHVLTLYVDPSPPPEVTLWPECDCLIMVSTETEIVDNSSLEDFTIKVNAGERIRWQGVSYYGEVKINRIELKSGDPIFKKPVNIGRKKVRARVERRAASGSEFNYKISYTQGDTSDLITIDPKILVR